MQNGVLADAIDAQRRENDEILRNANGVGAQLHRMQYSADPRLTIEQGRATAKREPPLRVGMRAFPIQFMSMDMQSGNIDNDACGFSESQEDSGAGMHLHNDLEDCVLGYTTEFTIYAGSADKGKDLVKLDAVGPLIRVFYGTDVHGAEVKTI